MDETQTLTLLGEFEKSDELNQYLLDTIDQDEVTQESRLTVLLETHERLIRDLEDSCVCALSAESGNVNEVLQSLDECCNKLEQTESHLDDFNTHLKTFLADVADIQTRSTASADIIKHNKSLHAALTDYIDKIIVTPALSNSIQKLQPPHPKFVEALEDLKLKICHAEEPGLVEFPSSQDCRRAVYELRAVAVEKCKIYLHNAIPDMFRKVIIPGTSLVESQVHFTTNTSALYQFLSSSNPLAAVQIRQLYAQNAARVNLGWMQALLDGLLRNPIRIVSEKSLYMYLLERGVPDSCLKSTQSQAQQSNWYSNIIPGAKEEGVVLQSERTSEQDFQVRMAILSTDASPESASFPEYVVKHALRALLTAAQSEAAFHKRYFFARDESPRALPRHASMRNSVDSQTSTKTDPKDDALFKHGLSLSRSDPIGSQKLFDDVFQKVQLMVRERLDRLIKDNYDVIGLSLIWKILQTLKQDQGSLKYLINFFDSIEIRCTTQLAKVLGALNRIAADICIEEASQSKEKSFNPFLAAAGNRRVIVNQDIITLYTSTVTEVVTVAVLPPRSSEFDQAVFLEIESMLKNLKEMLRVANKVQEQTTVEDAVSDLVNAQTLTQCFHKQMESTLGEVPAETSLDGESARLLSLISNAMEWSLERLDELGDQFAESIIKLVAPNFIEGVRKMELLIDEGSEGGETISLPVTALDEFKTLVNSHNNNWRQELTQIQHKILDIQDQEVRPAAKAAMPELMRQAFTKYLLFHSRLSSVMNVMLPDECIVPGHSLVSVVQSLAP
eukprot:Blabericola_migrator_1__3630@NODE_2086_length_3295_cov_80_065056_g1323_i0_p1_GENE_NODE_2086_length_3295_cov_80_065056_g1323_i0NODE_2086_length_3295_cov_80_065056_g1323_i0_p1_ORF_typecomplete_len787_score151_93Vps52/PF04129_12/6_6e33Vps52/PF04129_12/4_1e03Vps52/PF04129_12/2_2e03Sec3_C/PF09763_9/2_3e16Baculo_PEP_C/PF04513_12/0_0027Baculo_PEP_C/PF04513_12/1_8e03Baculo_PEP_C/PF04513_12/1_7e03Baculo_PEP_C/PF04513_12/4_4e02DUF2397/PF09660_10/0_047DUF2397/PF09660_10/2_2e02ActivatorTraM/PF11657_8/2e03Ac